MKKLLITLIVSLMCSVSIQAKNLSPEEIKKWELIGIKKMWIKNWMSSGINTPSDAKKWLELGETRITVRKWINNGIKNPLEAKQWKKLGVSSGNVLKYTKNNLNIEILKNWDDKGIPAYETFRFYKLGVISLDDAIIYKKADITTEDDFNYLKSIGIDTLEELNKWVSNNIGLKEIDEWKTYDISPLEAGMWKKIGYTHKSASYAINSWKELGVTDPLEVKKWLDMDLTHNYASRYIKLGITPEKLKEWNDAGIGGIAIPDYLKIGITLPEEAKLWKDAGIGHSSDLKYVKEANIKSAQELKEWKDAGVGLSDIKKWKKININKPDEAKKWNKVTDITFAGMWIESGVKTPKEIKAYKDIDIDVYDVRDMKKLNLNIKTILAWRKSGIKEISDISELTKNGFNSPGEYKVYKGINKEHAIKLKKWNMIPDKLIISMSKNNSFFGQDLYFRDEISFKKAYDSINDKCSEIQNNWFTAVEFSQNEDKCFMFVGKMIQRLDEKSMFGAITQNGLVRGNSNRYFYVEEFKGEWLEKTTKVGIIYGKGSYKYESKGGTKVVPKGEVLFF